MKFIAVDFDGTLNESAFPEIGEVKEIHLEVHDAIRKLKEEGNTMILWTCREDDPERSYLTEAIEWCKKYGLEFDYVNENPASPFGDTKRKIYEDIYIDDKSINPILGA